MGSSHPTVGLLRDEPWASRQGPALVPPSLLTQLVVREDEPGLRREERQRVHGELDAAAHRTRTVSHITLRPDQHVPIADSRVLQRSTHLPCVHGVYPGVRV